MKVDLELISGDFFDYAIPKQKQYLLKYFKSEIQRQFVRYYLIFGSTEHFIAHTGYFCKKRWLQLLVSRFNLLEEKLRRAREDFDLSTVALIESGKFRI